MMARRWTLTAKLVVTGAVFLAVALASVGLTLWVTWKLEGGAAAVNEAGRLRMQTYRLALNVTSASEQERASVPRLVAAFDRSLRELANGDATRPLAVPWSDTSRTAFSQVRVHWKSLRASWTSPQPPANASSDADAFLADIDAFVLAIEHEISRWTAILHLFQMCLMALAIASAVALLYSGYLLVLQPVSRLREGVAAVQAGNLSARVAVDSNDEFGDLSAGFNEMAQALQALYENLEAKVREKTESLETKRQRLADLYEVSVFLSSASSLDELGRGFSRMVRRIARADAAAVRWCDEGEERYIMLASESLPVSIVESESCLAAGQCACAQAPASASTRIIPIAGSQHAAGAACRKAGFVAVASIPVRLHDRILGEFDLFYTREVQLSAEDRELLDMLAAHFASAMEGLRAAALEREAAVAEERSLIARELHDSIAQSLAFMKIQVGLLRNAIARKDDGAAEKVLGELDAGVRESYADVRELLMHFRTRTTEEDITAALKTTLSKFEHQTGLKTRLSIEGHGVPLPPDVQVQVLHIIQEALSNVRKHSHAREVSLIVRQQPHWHLEVHDDGVGFDAQGAHGETHVGLRIMRERADRIGATVAVQSSTGQGCTVAVDLPRIAVPQPAEEIA